MLTLYSYIVFLIQVQSISSTYWTTEITEGLFTDSPNDALVAYAKTCNDQVCIYFI